MTNTQMRLLLKGLPSNHSDRSRALAAAALLITNFKEWWKASTRCRQAWVLYRVDSLHAGYFYIGVSSKPVDRAYKHLVGSTPFTEKHGMRSMTILAMFATRDEAETVERKFWDAKHATHGDYVGM